MMNTKKITQRSRREGVYSTDQVRQVVRSYFPGFGTNNDRNGSQSVKLKELRQRPWIRDLTDKQRRLPPMSIMTSDEEKIDLRVLPGSGRKRYYRFRNSGLGHRQALRMAKNPVNTFERAKKEHEISSKSRLRKSTDVRFPSNPTLDDEEKFELRELSGAGRKRYYRLRQQGLSHKQSLKKAKNPVGPLQPSPMQNDTAFERAKRQLERSSESRPRKSDEQTTFPDTVEKTSKSKSQKSSAVETTESKSKEVVRLAIVLPKFPAYRLTEEQMASLEEEILTAQQTANTKNVTPKFKTVEQKSGYLFIHCEDLATAEWLKVTVPKLEPWRNATLKVIPEFMLTTVDGETTSHLMGMFYRTIRLLENGIKPVYVFDGKPPDLKSGELAKRAEKRDEAKKALEKATEAGDEAEMDKFNRRLVRVTKEHAAEAKELLKLMGVPYVDAPCEAEAQCAAMVKAGLVYGTATEDMDALTFGSNIMLRHLTFSEARKMPVKEYFHEKILKGFELNEKEFIDLCILLGCDYCDSIKGVGPKRAVELINLHRNIETILEKIDKTKFPVPENWNYQTARELFEKPEILDPKEIELKWTEPDEEALVKFLCGDRQFSEERVRNGAKKILKSKNSSTQGRLDSFFKVLSTTTPKRKVEDDKKNVSKKVKLNTSSRGRKPK